jgi:hypothetical protein
MAWKQHKSNQKLTGDNAYQINNWFKADEEWILFLSDARANRICFVIFTGI